MICADNGTKSDALQTEGAPRRSLRSHPLFFGITMGLLSEIINSRYVFLPTWYFSSLKILDTMLASRLKKSRPD